MFDGRDAYVAFSYDGTTLCLHHILCDGLDDRLTFEINTLYLITGVLWGWVESHGKTQTCVQTLAAQGETTL